MRLTKDNKMTIKIIYPKEYIGFLIFSITFGILPSLGVPIFISEANERPLNISNIIICYTVILAILAITILSLLCIYKVVQKKIYIELNETCMTYKGIFKKTSIQYQDFSLIRMDTFRVNSIKLFFYKDSLRKRKSRIVIIPAWFSYKDLFYAIETIAEKNKDVELDGISNLR